jgi:protocatechuate 3,4-dioxygenase beta subunit
MRSVVILTMLSFSMGAQTSGGRGALRPNPASSPTAAAETPPEDLCTLEGRVTDAPTGQPVRKATLTLTPADLPQNLNAPPPTYTTATDSGGHFAMTAIEPGKYRLRVMRTGFVAMDYGARGPSRTGTILSLDRGARLKEIDFRLTPHAVLTGRVVDEDGDPVAGVQVQLGRMAYFQGRRQFSYAGGASTDDRGEYRMFGVAPGKYYLTATYRIMGVAMNAMDRSASPAPEEDYVPTYYPGTTNAANAAQIEVAAGAEMGNINLKLSKSRTVRIRGHVSQSIAAGRQPINILLMPRANDTMAMLMMFNRSRIADARGNFELAGVAPGQYYLRASMNTGDKSYAGRVAVDVGTANLENIAVTIEPGPSLRGQVRLEGDAPQPLTDLRIRLMAREPGTMMFGPNMAKVNEDGSFVLENITPDSYNVTFIGMPDGYFVKRVQLGDTESAGPALDLSAGGSRPVTITLSPNAAQITGSVQNAGTQKTAPGATVVIVPQEADRRDQSTFFKQTASDQFGNFSFKNVVPGEYKVFAWEDLEPGAYFDPDFMKPLDAKGEKLSVEESGRHTVQVTLIPAEGAAPAAARQ